MRTTRSYDTAAGEGRTPAGRAVARRAGAILLCVVLFVVASHHHAEARAPEGTSAEVEGRVQMARQAYSAGDTEEAARLYREALELNPSNERAFWGLVRVYSTSGENDLLVQMLLERLALRPNDRQARMELGEAYARLGDHDLAHEAWSGILGGSQTDVSDYTDIGSLEIRHRMYDYAIETYMSGRAAFRSKSLFSQELVTVHTALGDYSSAIDECAVTVNTHGSATQWAANRIELMLEQGAGRRLVMGKMDAISESEDATVEELGLAGSVYLVLDRPDDALAAFLRADDVAGGGGTQLLEYAEILRDEGLPEQARSAYLMVVERNPGAVAAARAGTAAAKLLAVSGDPEGAVLELRAVADAFEGSNRGADALYEAARLELDDLLDPAAAVATVEELRSRFGQRAHRIEDDAILIEVDANMMRGRFGDAHERAGSLMREGVREDIAERAAFARGFASFLGHDYDASTEEFRAMIESSPQSDSVNDALRLMLAMTTAQESGDMGPVDLLADAHAALLAGDEPRARERLETLASARTGAAVEAEALLLLGASATADGRYGDAIDHYDRIIDGVTAITPRAEAMMRKADILRLKLNRRGDAMDQYLAILENLPDNTLSGEARRKLDQLRREEG